MVVCRALAVRSNARVFRCGCVCVRVHVCKCTCVRTDSRTFSEEQQGPVENGLLLGKGAGCVVLPGLHVKESSMCIAEFVVLLLLKHSFSF